MKRGVLYLVVGIPASAVLVGMVLLYVAFTNADPGIEVDVPPMSKTSWRKES
jgi:hypothetical protein